MIISTVVSMAIASINQTVNIWDIFKIWNVSLHNRAELLCSTLQFFNGLLGDDLNKSIVLSNIYICRMAAYILSLIKTSNHSAVDSTTRVFLLSLCLIGNSIILWFSSLINVHEVWIWKKTLSPASKVFISPDPQRKIIKSTFFMPNCQQLIAN